MDMQGEYRIPAKRETVWEALNDPEVLKACIPGCQELTRTEDGGFEASVKAKVGPVSATFKGAVRLENVNPPESYTIAGEGKGGAAGFAKGGADVKLTEDGDETILNYEVKAQVGGKLAQIGARLVDSTAKKYATDFFATFAEIVQSRAGGAQTEDQTEQAAPEPSAAAPTPAPESGVEPAPVEAPAANEDKIREDATRAATEAARKTGAKRKGFSPTYWIIILIIALLGLTLIFNG
ncbi:carbon monoxide dehydrogenase subunit G [Rhodospirillaceae bacterium KN72]|uniref:Carbon monoxide dehydrogenase subunit G n=1 Tax=Pacificispira spongiicola TaxID=2729598 RepID=A0A7Y0DYP0_9PROT|nr:carbon monoxide dehydrogenase subunit G [Pacificispira spongiicola]NMM44044.1 carbon monoxide dehydrogenase subunit G [Pacificispira spongiicola]